VENVAQVALAVQPVEVKPVEVVQPVVQPVVAQPAEVKPEVKRKPRRANAELQAKETELKKKYPHMKLGTLVFNKSVSKFSVLIVCKCGKERRVYTSDLFQVKTCKDCKKSKAAKPKKTLAQQKASVDALAKEILKKE
jgi:hypothetical protein